MVKRTGEKAAKNPRGPRTSLAWLSLTHDRRRFFAAAAGVAFAIVLMWVELGFLSSIYDSTTLPIESFNADLILISKNKDNTNPSKPFARTKLAQTLAIPGVIEATPVYLSRWGTWRGTGSKVQDKVRIFGVDPSRRAFKWPNFDALGELIQRRDTALVDRRFRDSYGDTLRVGGTGEVDGRHLELVGDFELGPGLEMNSTLIVSEQTFAGLFFHPELGDPLQRVDYGLIRIADGAALDRIQTQIEGRLGDEIRVLTPDGLIDRIHAYWTRNKPVGAVFGLGVIVGFLIGIVICYQILFTDVIDHLPQFATLIAMGYSNRYLFRLAIRRGLYLAIAATVAAAPVCLWVYSLLGDLTSLSFRLSFGRAAVVAGCAALMCVIASLLAMRKAFDADPAELF